MRSLASWELATGVIVYSQQLSGSYKHINLFYVARASIVALKECSSAVLFSFHHQD